MSKIVLKADNLSKYFRLGTVGSSSFKEDVKLWLGGKNKGSNQERQKPDKHLWALKDVNFEIEQGDVVGFVGKNGSGKSTLLKIISRVCLPTSGSIKGRGRIAGLLEVGTGFHNDLTGRENIYLNGQILGMKKKEIDLRFDEIVDFSGVGEFLDTPVKRYSSGMYVRLAFAIAANLDPEILIVDEVLAVGDSEFQKKCLAKMKEISENSGRTVLFVSHNMQALSSLCTKAFYMVNGRLKETGSPDKVIANYLTSENIQYLKQEYTEPEMAPGNGHIKIKKAEVIIDDLPCGQTILEDTPLNIAFEFWNNCKSNDLITGIQVFTFSGNCVFDVYSEPKAYKNELIKAECNVPGGFLNPGAYYLSLVFLHNSKETLFEFSACLSFVIEERKTFIDKLTPIGLVKPHFPLTLHQY